MTLFKENTKELEEDSKWILHESFMARRFIDGLHFKLTKDGWHYKQPLEFVIGKNGRMWEWAPVYREMTISETFNLIWGKYPKLSNMAMIDEFESAETLGGEYPLGNYILFNDVNGEFKLVNFSDIPQVSNFQDIELTEDNVYQVMRDTMRIVQADVVLESLETDNRVVIYKSEFDWDDNE